MVHAAALPRDCLPHLLLDERGSERRPLSGRPSRAPRWRSGSSRCRARGVDADRAHGIWHRRGDGPSLHEHARTDVARIAPRRGRDMKIVILHNSDALEPPVDPIIEQLSGALRSLDHETETVVVDGEIDELVVALRRHAPDLVFNITESFRGKSALDSNIAALLNLIDYRYTGSSPAGLFLAGDKSLTKKVLRFH